jgi:glycopeptide antibiotics resistance protein
LRNTKADILRKLLAPIALGSYLTVLIATSLWPKPVDGQGLLAILTSEILMFTRDISWLHWIQYNQLEALANILLYIPLGVFLEVIWPNVWTWKLCVFPILVSVLAEGAQRLFLPDRYATVNDVIFNSMGGVLGVLIAASIRRLMKNSKSER